MEEQMDQITLLRRLADDIDEPDAGALANARARLIDQITDVAPAPRTSWVRSRPATFALVAAVAVAALLVVGSIALAGPGTGPSAQAATELDLAAVRIGSTDDPIVAAGQYLRIRTSAAYIAGDADNGTSYLEPQVEDLYIPSDRDGVWVKQTVSVKPTVFFGGEPARAFADREWKDTVAAGVTQTVRAVGGNFPVAPEFGGGTLPVDDIATMSRDPKRLLDYLGDSLPRSERADTGLARETDVFGHVVTLLESGTTPPDLRAALYRALALLPDVTITDHQSVLDGRRGTAFGLPRDGRKNQQEIIIDPTTGQFIGEREVLVKDYLGVPAGTPIEFTAVTASVVNSAP
jgi:hypothetical protein